MTIQVVFFDMGGTIETYHSDEELRIRNSHFLRESLLQENIEFDLSDSEFTALVSKGIATYHDWSLESQIELPTAQIWSKFVFKGISISEEKLALISEELSQLFEQKFYIRKMRPEIPAVLAKIKNMGLKIGCISNTFSLGCVYKNLSEYGILESFDPIVLSSIYGRRKPDPSIFYHAARLANAPTSECIYIGDKILRDVTGARRAGYKKVFQILHQYDDGENDEGLPADAMIENMTEILPILEKEMAQSLRHCFPAQEKKIRTIFFDAGDILYHRPRSGANLQHFLEGKSHIPHPQLSHEKYRLKDKAFQGKIDLHEYHQRIIQLYGFTDPKEIEDGIKAIEVDDNCVEIMEGVPETLKALKRQGYLLGIITDTALPISMKLNWFEKYGFGNLWDSIISSREIGVRKPSPLIYHEALSQTGTRPEEAVFVGHKATELQGACRVGMFTVAFNYEKKAKADFYIDRFSDLLEIPLLTHPGKKK